MTNTASETGREGLVGQAASQMGDAAAGAQEKAAELKQQGRSKLGETLDQRTTQAGGQARQMAQALRRTGEQMRQQGEGSQVAGMTDGAAERIERLGGYLEQTSGDDLLRDVEDFARRRPWMVAGIGLMVGMAASRFLKASSERRYDSGQGRPYRSRYGYGTTSVADDYGHASVGPETGTAYGSGTASPDVSDYETAGRQSEAGRGGASRGEY